MDSLILSLADRGAKFYIAAGNEDINPSATKALGQHKNIFIVASSDGIIGEEKQTEPTKLNIYNPATNRVANGVLKPITSQNGIDLNRDGKIDFPNSILRNPSPDLTGKSVKNAYAEKLIEEMRSTKDIVHQFYLMGREDIKGKVLSIKDLRRFGFIDEDINKYLKNNYKIINESQTYIDLEPLSIHLFYEQKAGDIVLYENQQNALTKLLPSYKPTPFTSWATPNALSEDVIKDFGHH